MPTEPFVCATAAVDRRAVLESAGIADQRLPPAFARHAQLERRVPPEPFLEEAACAI